MWVLGAVMFAIQVMRDEKQHRARGLKRTLKVHTDGIEDTPRGATREAINSSGSYHDQALPQVPASLSRCGVTHVTELSTMMFCD
jgi:hypothetical protein